MRRWLALGFLASAVGCGGGDDGDGGSGDGGPPADATPTSGPVR